MASLGLSKGYVPAPLRAINPQVPREVQELPIDTQLFPSRVGILPQEFLACGNLPGLS